MGEGYWHESQPISRIMACESVGLYSKDQIKSYGQQLSNATPWNQMRTEAAPAWKATGELLGSFTQRLRSAAERLSGQWTSADSAACQKALQRIAGTASHLARRSDEIYHYTDRTAGSLERANNNYPDWNRDLLNQVSFGAFGQGDPSDEDYRKWLGDLNMDYYQINMTLPEQVEVQLPELEGPRDDYWQTPPGGTSPSSPSGLGDPGGTPRVPSGNPPPTVPPGPGGGNGGDSVLLGPGGVSAREAIGAGAWNDSGLDDGSSGGLAGAGPMMPPGGGAAAPAAPVPGGGGLTAPTGGPAGAPAAGTPLGTPVRPGAMPGMRPGVTGGVTSTGSAAGGNGARGGVPGRGAGAGAGGAGAGGARPMPAKGVPPMGGAGAGGARGGAPGGRVPGAGAGGARTGAGVTPPLGTGARGKGKDKDGQYDSWLVEDEDPWGADEAAPSVID